MLGRQASCCGRLVATVIGTLGAVAAAGGEGAPAAPPGGESGRIDIKLPHKGTVYGEGPEWDKQYAREALQIFKDLKPDPAWVAKLKGLPDNTWMRCNPKGDQQPESWRSEVPMVYVPSAHAFMFMGGCTAPSYSSDTWAYHTGANRWVQMWPNYIIVSDSEAPRLNKEKAPRNRPWHRCSLGLASDTDRNVVVLRGGANSGDGQTWVWDPATNEWRVEAKPDNGYQRAAWECNCLGHVPGLGVVEIGGDQDVKKNAATWVFRATAKKWETVKTAGSPPGGVNSRLVWASGPQLLMFWCGSRLWSFEPKASAWEDITPREGPKPGGFYRQGLAYDSTNNVLILYGGADRKEGTHGPWVYSFAAKRWEEMKPANGPSGVECGQQMMDYDPEYNVVFIAGHGRGSWVYRYKQVLREEGGK